MKGKQLSEFLWDLYYLTEGKVPINEALEIIKNQKKSNTNLLEKTLVNITEGHGLSYSLKDGGLDNQYVLKVLEVAEQGDFIEEALLDLCNLMEEKENLKNKIISSLIYPAILLIFALITIIFTFSYVVPSVLNIYTALNIEKSLLLKITLKINIGYLILGFVGLALIYGYINYRRGKIHRIFLIGPIIYNLDKFIFYKMLANLLKGGVPLYQAVEIVSSFPRKFGGPSLQGVLQGLFKGKPLHIAISDSKFDNSIAVNFIRIAEESGGINKGIERVENFYKRNLDHNLIRFGKIFEPIVIALVGITVVTVVLILLLPIYQLYQNM